MTVLTLFSADQDKAMEVAIAKVFPDIFTGYAAGMWSTR
jgi:hypothetical protein